MWKLSNCVKKKKKKNPVNLKTYKHNQHTPQNQMHQ